MKDETVYKINLNCGFYNRKLEIAGLKNTIDVLRAFFTMINQDKYCDDNIAFFVLKLVESGSSSMEEYGFYAFVEIL